MPRSRDVQTGTHDVWYTRLFEEPLSAPGWVSFFADGVFRQRYLIAAGDHNLFCETSMRVAASPDAVLAAIRGPWSWWAHGAQDERRVQPDGTVTYVLWPALAFGRQRVGVREPDGAGGSVVRGRFAGVDNKVLYMTQRVFVETHLKAERGALSLPFRRGTGWPGLKQLLERNPTRPRM